MNELIGPKERFEEIARSTERFPVDFEEAWQWAEYARKDSALRKLTENFEKGMDFDSTILWNQNIKSFTRGGDRRTVKYSLSVDCFKSFCMLAETKKGNEVRLFYLKIEKAWNTPELVLARALQMGVLPQPEEPKSYYPFFDKADFAERSKFIMDSYDKGLISREEFRAEVLYRNTYNPAKTDLVLNKGGTSVVTLSGNQNEEIQMREPEKPDPAVSDFVEKFLDITGSKKDFIQVQELFAQFTEKAGGQLSRNIFVRQLKKADPRVIYKQKKINDYPVLVFSGIRLRPAVE